jgi:hypothetical protein
MLAKYFLKSFLMSALNDYQDTTASGEFIATIPSKLAEG